MLFNSYVFVFLFFPLCLGGYYISLKLRKALVSKAFLIAMSLGFYGWFQPVMIFFLLAGMALNYGIYMGMVRSVSKKPWLAAGLAANLSTLFLFKYFNFFIEIAGNVGSADIPALKLMLPLGISFFTFEQMAFLMEAYRGNLPKTNCWDYCLYISFFPKLLQGPIALPQEMLGQFAAVREKRFDWEKIYRGLFLFTLGLFKKVLIADTFGRAVDYGYGALAALNSGDAILVMLFYTFQLYFDFSGYCDMAMGIAWMLGFELPLNFDSPYKATNIIGFWKGWHITLTRFFTKYLYIPLGGNRKGKIRTYVNYLLVFFVSGIWHGAGVTFIVWGILHGALYVITKGWQNFRASGHASKEENPVSEKGAASEGMGRSGTAERGLKLLGTAGTFLFVNIAWVFFRSASISEALELLKTIFRFEFGKINWTLAGFFNLDEFWYVIKILHVDSWQYAHYILMVLILIAVLFLVFIGKTAMNVAGRVKPAVWNALLMAGLLVWSVIAFSQVSSFLYVNF